MTEQTTIPTEKVGSYIVTLPVASIKVGTRCRQDHGDIGALAASIKELGLLQPIGVDREHRLVYGERRLRACQHLGYENIQARIINVASIVQAERDENEVRKDFTPSERVAIAKAIEDELKAIERRGRPKAETGQGELIETENVQNFAQLDGVKSREIAAKKAGFGNPETYRQARKVTEEATPELVAAMDKGEIAISTAAKLVKANPEVQKEAVANPKAAPKLAKEGGHSGTGIKEIAVPDTNLENYDGKIRDARSYARKIASALNVLKGKEEHLDPKDKAPLVRNLKAALRRLGEKEGTGND